MDLDETIKMLGAQVLFIRGVSPLLIASNMHGYLLAFGEDVDHAAGIDHFDFATNQPVRHTVVMLVL